MDDLLREFLTETGEHLDTVDVELVRFEQEPDNETVLRNIFRLVHTIKGTCGFLDLPRLEALAHAAETLMGQFRDELPVTGPAVTLILATIDRIKDILAALERHAAEPAGADLDLIGGLEHLAGQPPPGPTAETDGFPIRLLNRALRPGEVSLGDLERAFREAPGPDDPALRASPAPAPASFPIITDLARRDSADAVAETNETATARVQTIRVNVDMLEHLMTMVSELVLTRNQLLDVARRDDDSAYKAPLQRLSHVTAELQDGVMKTRMQPIGAAWQKLPRLIRDLSSELGKAIDLTMLGAETELDRQVLEVIKDPLTHMVRNSADHGIESAPERRAAGKPERGHISVSASHEGGTIAITFADDGRGLDFGAIRRKAVERGIAGEAEIERMSDQQVAKFIFHPGFSTANAVTAISGRGVGMDVVQTNIGLIGGSVDIASELGRGTTFTIRIPLTLAIVAALIVGARDQRYAIPQGAVLELIRVGPGSAHAIERLNGAPVLRLRERLLPIVPISRALELRVEAGPSDERGFVVVTEVGRQRFGILVDAVLHTEEIVVKPMSSALRHIPLFSGNTILGDGAVVLIIDPNGIGRLVGSEPPKDHIGSDQEAPAGQAQAPTLKLLVFRGGQALKAVPLSLVTRLEEIEAAMIEWIGGRPLIQYRGRLMPLVPADPESRIRRDGPQLLVIFSEGERAMGLAVDEIVDIVEDKLDIELSTDRADLVGSAVVRGRATEIIDLAHYLPLARTDWIRNAPKTNRTVMLVDDSAFFRDMLAPVLSAEGYRVLPAQGVDEALSLLESSPPPDVVVTDIDMPGRNGFDLIEALRADGRFGSLPVIALSSGVTPAHRDRARKLAIAAFVAKFDRSGLLAALAETQAALGEAA